MKTLWIIFSACKPQGSHCFCGHIVGHSNPSGCNRNEVPLINCCRRWPMEWPRTPAVPLPLTVDSNELVVLGQLQLQQTCCLSVLSSSTPLILRVMSHSNATCQDMRFSAWNQAQRNYRGRKNVRWQREWHAQLFSLCTLVAQCVMFSCTLATFWWDPPGIFSHSSSLQPCDISKGPLDRLQNRFTHQCAFSLLPPL